MPLRTAGFGNCIVFFCEQFPDITKELAIAILFIPSVVFWGSGLLKDTITFSAAGWLIYTFYKILNNKPKIKYLVYLITSAFLLLSIKPYILYTILIASSVWLAIHYLKKLPTLIEKYIYAPVFLLFFSAITILATIQLGKDQGHFSIATSENELQVKQSENIANSTFKKEQVGNTYMSIIKSIPSNLGASLFRPYFWEAKSAITVLAALESFFLLIFLVWILIKFKLSLLLKFLFSNPFLVFSLVYILILSFVAALYTDNFGTLNRFRIPVLPFFISLCFILKSEGEKWKLNQEKIIELR